MNRGQMGLDYNTGLRRSSLRLDIQDNTVFILSQSEHGPGHGRMSNQGTRQ